MLAIVLTAEGHQFTMQVAPDERFVAITRVPLDENEPFFFSLTYARFEHEGGGVRFYRERAFADA